MCKTIRIATRNSQLALKQSEFVKQKLLKYYPTFDIKLVKTSTTGDKFLNKPLYKIGGKSLFIKELEQKILNSEADIAVHSLKDMPHTMPAEFSIGAVLKREDPRDAFISNKYNDIVNLPNRSIVGTCSSRRIIQLKLLRPDLQIKDLRGNINTRLVKLDNNEYDAIILAVAGLKRLGLKHRITKKINHHNMLPAVGQGVIAVEAKDSNILKLLKKINHATTAKEVSAERIVNKKLAGNCATPIAVFAKINKEVVTIKAMVGNLKNNLILSASITGSESKIKDLSEDLAHKIIAMGAKKILNNNG